MNQVNKREKAFQAEEMCGKILEAWNDMGILETIINIHRWSQIIW